MTLLKQLAALSAAVVVSSCGGGPAGPLPVPDPMDYGSPVVEVLQLSGPPPMGGPMTGGRAGDWLLRNERIGVVISAIENPRGFSKSGGNLVDAAPLEGADLLCEVFTFFDDSWPRQAVYTELRAESPFEDTRTIVVAGSDSHDSTLTVETTYSLSAGSDRVSIQTRLVNTGSTTYLDFELGDAIEWGRAEPFVPGAGRSLAGTRAGGPWLAADGGGTGYVFLSEGGIEGPHSATWSDPIYTTANIAPGDTVSYMRWLVIARGSAAEAVHRVLPDSLAEAYIQVVEDGDAPVSGAEVTVRDENGAPVQAGYTRADGWVIFSLLEGEYTFDVRHGKRGEEYIREDITALNTNSHKVRLPRSARVPLISQSAGLRVPARWSLTGIDDTPTPDLGPDWEISGAGNYVFTPSGSDTFSVPSGKYLLTCSRGPRYEVWQREVSLGRGNNSAITAELTPVPLENGWVSMDLHTHAIPSPDSPLDPRARVQSLACEGVDAAAITDHGHRSGYEDYLAELALPVAIWVGEEVTTDTLGHFNVFPGRAVPGAWGRGAINPEGKSVSELFTEVRARDGASLIQVNHPRAGRNGYLDQFSFDSFDYTATEGFSDNFDLMEVMNGKRQENFPELWEDWKSMLGQGNKIVGVGNSDSHRLVEQEAGFPRNFVYAPDGDVLGALKAGRVFVTSGPLIEFTLGGARLGDRLETEESMLTGRLRVTAASWVKLKQVKLLVNGKLEAVYPLGSTSRQVRFDEDVQVMVPHGPAFVQVLVEGEAGWAPVHGAGAGRELDSQAVPMAFTNPIWLFRDFPSN